MIFRRNKIVLNPIIVMKMMKIVALDMTTTIIKACEHGMCATLAVFSEIPGIASCAAALAFSATPCPANALPKLFPHHHHHHHHHHYSRTTTTTTTTTTTPTTTTTTTTTIIIIILNFI
jgi:hypothetical protein